MDIYRVFRPDLTYFEDLGGKDIKSRRKDGDVEQYTIDCEFSPI